MKCITKLAALLILGTCGTLSQQASASLIVGEISFSGSYTTNNSNLTLATKFNSFSAVTVAAGPTLDYAPFAGASVTQNAFTFDPFPAGGIVPLWSITLPQAASFDLLSLTIDFESPSVLVLSGTGTAHLAGKDATPGRWTLSANTFGTTFSFSSTNASFPTALTP